MRATYRKYEETYYRIYKQANICHSVTVGGIFEQASVKIGNGVQSAILKKGQRIPKKQFDQVFKIALKAQKPIVTKKNKV